MSSGAATGPIRATIVGSLPKPGWLAETNKLWPAWRAQGAELERAKRDATLLWLKEQEDAGIDIVTDGEQSRQHFVHGFLEHVEGIDFERKVEIGIRADRYKAMVSTMVMGPGMVTLIFFFVWLRIRRASAWCTRPLRRSGPTTCGTIAS